MDVDRLARQTVAKNNDPSLKASFGQAAGSRASAMEHLVPEQMFSTTENPAHGISAVKALSIASAEGQKIWTITHENLDIALLSINLPVDTETEIRNAILAGKVVTAHENQIDFYGWIGEGYIMTDPETGAGAYLIAGGENGGWISTILGAILFLAGLFFVGTSGALIVTIAGVARALAGIALVVISILSQDSLAQRVGLAGVFFAIVGIAFYFPAFLATLGIAGSELIPLIGILGIILSIIGPSPFL